jgi:hypothetical protein
MCTDNDPAYTSSMWFRGKQVTDAFIVTVDGKSTLTSQFVFDDALDDEIIATQPIYKDRGARDTTNKTDDVVPTDKRDAYAYKTIAIPNSMCSLGGPGGPGFGHPPHDDRPPFIF